MSATRIFVLICFSFILCGNVFETSAQTYRVSCGVNASGHRTYKEVYEYDYVSEKPSFPGGTSEMLAFVNKTRKYPEQAYKIGIEGRVICSFVVNTDGSISHIKVLKGVESSLNEEAIRILSQMPIWNPGRHNNQNVPVRVIYPIAFRK